MNKMRACEWLMPFLLFLPSCASAPKRSTVTSQGQVIASAASVDPGWIVALSGRGNDVGHGCPVSEHFMLTAAHMTTNFYPGLGFVSFPLRWSDSAGNGGEVQHRVTSPAADIALMHSEASFAVWYQLAKGPPKAGDVVYLVGYDFSSSRFQMPRLVQTKVVSSSAGHIYYEKDGDPGSSGSCLLSEDMTVLGINVTINGSPRDPSVRLGGSVAVWGPWLPGTMWEAIKGGAEWTK